MRSMMPVKGSAAAMAMRWSPSRPPEKRRMAAVMETVRPQTIFLAAGGFSWPPPKSTF